MSNVTTLEGDFRALKCPVHIENLKRSLEIGAFLGTLASQYV